MCSDSNTRLLMRLIVDILLFASVYCVALAILPQTLKTHHRGFFCGDESLMYPYYPETILKRLHVTLLVIALPAALIVSIEMLRAAFPANTTKASLATASTLVSKSPQRYVFVGVKIPRFVSECYNVMGVYLFGLALVLVMSSCLQMFTGRLAPYFFEVCQPLLSTNSTACTEAEHFGHYIEKYSCSSLTSSPQLLTSMRHSFPSSHSSTSAYAMCFMAIYLQARLQTGWLKLWRTLLQFAAIMISLLVAGERFISYRHHWSDVLAGLVVGYAFAFFMTHLVLDLLRKVPIKVRRIRRDDTTNVYGYYTVMPRPRYF